MTRSPFLPSAVVPPRGDRARERLLAAAIDLFGARGPEGVTVREIARQAGQNVAAIAYYFGSKDQLYQAALERIVQEIRSRLADVLEEIVRLRQEVSPEPQAALRLLQRFLSAVYLRLLSRTEALPIARIIVREQMQPTPAFEILYERGFREVHEALCFLVGRILGRDFHDPQTILHTHMLMGQVYFFAMSREAILRRLRWKSLEGTNARRVTDLLTEHLEVLLSGLAAKAGQPPLLS